MYTICKEAVKFAENTMSLSIFFFNFHDIKIGAFTGILKLANKFHDFAVWNRMQPVRIAFS